MLAVLGLILVVLGCLALFGVLAISQTIAIVGIVLGLLLLILGRGTYWHRGG